MAAGQQLNTRHLRQAGCLLCSAHGPAWRTARPQQLARSRQCCLKALIRPQAGRQASTKPSAGPSIRPSLAPLAQTHAATHAAPQSQRTGRASRPAEAGGAPAAAGGAPAAAQAWRWAARFTGRCERA